MKDVKIVIGSNFGSEGKGLMTDYFCSMFPYNKNILNIRFNGGSQSTHTCTLSSGESHIFSHFGAGSFNENVTTYLASGFLVNPFKFQLELKELKNLGIKPRISISKKARVVLTYDIFFNHVLELSRKEKHGSAGAGIYETILRNETEDYSLTVQDLYVGTKELYQKILSIRDEYYVKRLKDVGININETDYAQVWNSKIFLISLLDEIKAFMYNIEITDDEEILNKFDYQVYEGSSGLLLDSENKEFFPHLSPFPTGVKLALSLISKIKDRDIRKEVCYVSRPYFTKHGFGPFPSETNKKDLKGKIYEKTNKPNDFQGVFRYGYFDDDLFKKAINKDIQNLKNKHFKVSIAITHLDETKGKILLKDGSKSATYLKKEFPISRLYFAFGDTRENINYR